ncbi:MAG: tetratricopeptide repeat protein [Phycisphaerales bacterium]|nr:tetratricopeptide repeat protein [Phycisphaerales bacterium]
MASRVNTKFVIILSVAVVALLAMVGVAYSVVKKSGADHIAAGDKMMAEGNYEKAKSFYGKAVNKDQSRADWVDKWIDAMEHITPETETAYRDAFQSDYMGALTFASTIRRTDVAAHKRLLDIYYEMLKLGYSRAGADRLIEASTRALTYFDNPPAGSNEWKSLRRYRGFGYDRIVQAQGVIDEDQIALYREDLEAALEANPSDGEAMAALIRWSLAEALRTQIEGEDSKMIAARNQGIKDADAFLAEHPNDPDVSTIRLTMEMDNARDIAGAGLEDAARTTAIVERFTQFLPKVEAQFAMLNSLDPHTISANTIELMIRLENAADPESKLTRTRALMDRVVDADPTDPDRLWASARINSESGDNEAAVERFRAITALPNLPMSFEGMMLYTRKRQSLISIANIRLDDYQIANLDLPEGAAPVEPELLQEAEQLMGEFAKGVSEDDNQLIMLRGRIAEAKNDLNTALSLYKKYNEQTKREFAEGLWREGVVARKLGQLGTARTALNLVIAKRKYDQRAMLALADIEMQLNNPEAAAEQYRKILIYDPTNELATQGMAATRAMQDPSSISESNPSLALILRSRQIRTGTDGQPGDLSSAIELLKKGIVDPAIDYEPSVTRELAMLLMDNGDLVGARATVMQSVARFPDDELMGRLSEALEGDDPVEILITLVRQSDQNDLDKDISIANILMRDGRFEQLDKLLAELAETHSDDYRVVEIGFTRALQRGDTAMAERLAQAANANNLDGVRGLTYQARILAYKDEHAKAVQVLQQATALGTADASVFRMLAMEQRVIGQIDSSADSFQRALAIRPDDRFTIYEYVSTLTAAGRFEQALDVARANQKYGVADPDFNNLWLMLEAHYGGDQGREFAIRQRERMLELNPTDTSNTLELARMYVAAKQWDEAKVLIDSLMAGGSRLEYVDLLALWNADQGRVGKENGLALARSVYHDYIDSLGDDLTDRPFISLARFMLSRGRPDLATQAANEAVRLENPETMEGSKLQGDLQMSMNQFAAAAAAYTRVVDAGADTNNEYRAKLIEANLRLKKYDEALSQLDALPETEQATKVSMLQRAEILNGLDRLDESRRVLDDVVAKYSDDPIVFIKRAESMIGEPSLLTDLLADVDQALKMNGNDWRAYRVRAAAFFAADRKNDALADLMSAVRINPNLDSALFGVLNELINSNRPGEAFDLAKEVVERRSNDAPLMSQIGHIFASRKDWNRACEFYSMAWNKRRSPSDGATYIDALVRRSPPDTTEANAVINDLGTLIGGVDKSPGLLAASALVLDARGRGDFAVQQLTKAFDISIDEDSKLLGWYSNVARFYESKPIDQEIAYLDSVRQRKDIPSVQAWIDLFICQRMARDQYNPERATKLLNGLIARPENPALQRMAYQTYGSMLFAANKYEQARDLWIEGVKLFPQDWEMNNNLAYVMSEKLGASEDALVYAEATIGSGITRSEPFETLARIYTRLGRYDEASEMIRQGMTYALSIEARVTMILAEARLKLAKGELDAARGQVLNAKSILRSLPGVNEDIEKSIQEVESEIASAG